MREFAVSMSRYSRTIPSRLLASIPIFAILTQAYWIAVTLRLMGVLNPGWHGDTPAQIDVFAVRSAQFQFGALLVLALLALELAGILGECGFIFGAVIIGTCLLGYFSQDIPLPTSPIATHFGPSLAQHISDGISHYWTSLVVVDLIVAWLLYDVARGAVKRSAHKARLPKGIEDTAQGSTLFVVMNIRRTYAASAAIFLTLAACLTLLILMRSTLSAVLPQQYAESDSASAWLICILYLLLVSCCAPWLGREDSRRVITLSLIGVPVLALWPKVITFPVPGQFPAGPNAFWIGIVAYPLAAAIGYTSLSRILKWNTAA